MKLFLKLQRLLVCSDQACTAPNAASYVGPSEGFICTVSATHLGHSFAGRESDLTRSGGGQSCRERWDNVTTSNLEPLAEAAFRMWVKAVESN